MRLTRSRRPAVLVVALSVVSAVLLAGCGAPTGSAKPAAVQGLPALAPVAAIKAAANCRDGRPPTASIAPGGITEDPSTWPANSTMAKIKKRGRLIVGTSGDVLLWGARNPKTGNLEGYDIDVLAEVAKALRVDPKKTEYRVINYGQRLPHLDQGLVDVVAHTMTINCDRWQGTAAAPSQYIDFSSEYYEAGQRVLVRSDSSARSIQDLQVRKGQPVQPVCVAAASTNLDNLQPYDVDKVVVADLGDCLVKFQEGEVAAITGDDTVLAGFAAQDPYAKIVGPLFSSEPYGLGIPPQDADFTRFVNAVLEKLRSDGTLTSIYHQTMGKAVPTAPAVPAPVYGRVVAGLGRKS